MRATQHLDRWDDYLLVSNSPARDPDGVATGKKHFGVSASTVAGDVQRVLYHVNLLQVNAVQHLRAR